MLKLLHTADLHLGLEFGQVPSAVQRPLAQARLAVVDAILGVARRHDVAAVLWAGDVFDKPDPHEDWWRGFAAKLASQRDWTRPVVLLPGNHDPLLPSSVYHPTHEFRRLLPDWVHVVDRAQFELALGPDAVLYAAPCQSRASDDELALSLPPREAGDTRIRVGLVHGSTFDLPGYRTNFPIATDAPAQRGLDYLAVGDTHGYRLVGSDLTPIVYPGAPEPTKFGETDAGDVVIVSLRRSGARPGLTRERVGRWTWRDEVVANLESLRSLAAEDLSTTVLRLRLDMTVTAAEEQDVETQLALLEGNLAVPGRAGAVVLDRTGLQVTTGSLDKLLEGQPDTLVSAARRLEAEAVQDLEAGRALRVLVRLLAEAAR